MKSGTNTFMKAISLKKKSDTNTFMNVDGLAENEPGNERERERE